MVMVIPSWGQMCGVAEYTKSLACALRKEGFPVEITTGRAEEIMPFVYSAGYGIAHFQFEYRLFDVRGLRRLLSRLDERGVRAIATMHDFCPGNAAANGLVRDAFPDVIVHSARLGEELRRLGIDRSRIHVIPMGCPQVMLADEAKTRADLHVGPGPAIGFFGFVLPQKGLVELAVAAKVLRQRVFPHLKVFAFAAPAFFGAEYARELADTLHSCGLEDGFALRTDYLPLQEVANYLHAMDINVLPYKEAAYIGTSSAVRVLMSAEKPIITTDIPYFEDLDGEVFKIPSADPGRIADAVMYLMADSAKREEMVARIREYVRCNNWTEISRKHAALYRARGNEAHPPVPLPQGRPIQSVPPEVWARIVRRFGRGR